MLLLFLLIGGRGFRSNRSVPPSSRDKTHTCQRMWSMTMGPIPLEQFLEERTSSSSTPAVQQMWSGDCDGVMDRWFKDSHTRGSWCHRETNPPNGGPSHLGNLSLSLSIAISFPKSGLDILTLLINGLVLFGKSTINPDFYPQSYGIPAFSLEPILGTGEEMQPGEVMMAQEHTWRTCLHMRTHTQISYHRIPI